MHHHSARQHWHARIHVRALSTKNIHMYPQLLLGPDGHTSFDVEPDTTAQFGAPPLLDSFSAPLSPFGTQDLSGDTLPDNPLTSLPVTSKVSDNNAGAPLSFFLSAASSTTTPAIPTFLTTTNSRLPLASGSPILSASSPNSKVFIPFVTTSRGTPTESAVPSTAAPVIVIASASATRAPLPYESGSHAHSTSSSSNVFVPFFTTFPASSTGAIITTTTNTATRSALPSTTTSTAFPVLTSSPSLLPSPGNTSRTVGIVVGSIIGALAGLILILVLSLYILRVRIQRKHRNDNVYRDVEDKWPPYNAHTERVHGIGRVSDEGMSTGSSLSTSLDAMPVPQSLHVANHAPGDFSSDERSCLSPDSRMPSSGLNSGVELPFDIYGTPRIARAPFLAVPDNGLAYAEPSTPHLAFREPQGIVRDPYLSRAVSTGAQHPSTLSAGGWRADVLRNKLFASVLLMKDSLSGSGESLASDHVDGVAQDHFTRVPTRSSVGSAGGKRRPSSTDRALFRLPSMTSEYSQASTGVPVPYSSDYSMGAFTNPHPQVSRHLQMPKAAYVGHPFEPLDDPWPSTLEADAAQKRMDYYTSWTEGSNQDDVRRPISLPPDALVTVGRFLRGGDRKRGSSTTSAE